MTDEAEGEAESESWGCYRHPMDEAGVKCTRCDRPICPRCMITAPVGFQCPECVKGAPPVRNMRQIQVAAGQAHVTTALVAINAAVFVLGLAGGGNELIADFALNGPAVAQGDWYRLITAGFLHFNLIHVGFNMLILYRLGQMLEPAFGRLRFGLLYATALIGGSVGALILSPNAYTAGASGAVFGLMGAAAVALRQRGINIMQSSIGGLLVMNLVLTFAIRGISIGGHLGGLAAGVVAGFVLERADKQVVAGSVAVGALAVVLLGVGIAIA